MIRALRIALACFALGLAIVGCDRIDVPGAGRPAERAIEDGTAPADKAIQAPGETEDTPAEEPFDAIAAPSSTSNDGPRLALIIAIEAYSAPVRELTFPDEDAEVMRAALDAAGFEVTVVTDPGKSQLRDAVSAFSARLAAAGPDSVGFVYFSGHGGAVETQGIRRNYLLPANAPVSNARELELHGVRTAEIIDDLLTAQAKAVFLVIDACRNTLPGNDRDISGFGDKGMVRVNASNGLFMAFAAADGETAPDDGQYARELAAALGTKGASYDRVFTLAHRAVAQSRPSGKYPMTSDGLRDDIFFAGKPGSTPAAPAQTGNPSDGLGPFTYLPPGWLYDKTGAIDSTLYAPDMAFPIASGPAFLNSSIYTPGGGIGGGDQCHPANFVYPWVDNFCERRSSRNTAYKCGGSGHTGSDIRAGNAGICNDMRRTAAAERDQVPVIAVEDGVITAIGTYTVTLTSTDGARVFRYSHLNMQKLRVVAGDTVKKRDLIGYLSNDFGGTPTTLHLHFEIRVILEDTGLTNVSPYMSLIRAYERDRGIAGISLSSFRPEYQSPAVSPP